MDQATVKAAMLSGDFAPLIKALTWDACEIVVLPACSCGETTSRDMLVVRDGSTILAMVPGNAHGITPSLEGYALESPERAEEVMSQLLTRARDAVIRFEAQLGTTALQDMLANR
jgi:hypothetical protein